MDTNESLTYYGGAVKALGGGKIGGYLILFTGPNDPDLQGDFFTKSTDFYLKSGDERPIIYDHGLDKTIKRRTLGRGAVRLDDVGVWMEGQLEMRDKYEKSIYEMVQKGKLGWSSGSASHLVSRTPKNKAFELDSWPIVEASLTPKPVEPRTAAIPLKSLEHTDLETLIKSFTEEQIEAPPPSIDGYAALKEIIAPSDLKGLDERSDAVGAAVEEFFRHGRMLAGAVKSHAVFLEDHARLRFERDGRPVSKPKRLWVETARQRLAKMMADHQELDNHLAGIQKLFNVTDLDGKVTNEKVRHELLRMHKLSGTPLDDPLQGDNNDGRSEVIRES